jgi:hypothetical protein
MFEIGLPSIDTMRYLFKYNDEKINPDNLTDFNDPKFDGVFQLAADAHITAADVTNIFTDIVIYSGSVESMDENGEVIEPTKEEDVEICTPEKIRDAIERIKGRNQMSGRSFIDSERDED